MEYKEKIIGATVHHLSNEVDKGEPIAQVAFSVNKNKELDFHKDAIPSPYPHSNIDSDEFIFYSEGKFMSRSGIRDESITLHPMGLPHGPQPGKYESSIGKKGTEELAVMIDTFRPLYLTKSAIELSDKDYCLSWIK